MPISKGYALYLLNSFGIKVYNNSHRAFGSIRVCRIEFRNTYISSYFAIAHILRIKHASGFVVSTFNGSGRYIPSFGSIKFCFRYSVSIWYAYKSTFFISRVKAKISYSSYIEVFCFGSEHHTSTLSHRACRESKS